MGTISVSLPSDGQTIDAADYNTPINTIVSEINGSLDSNNIAEGGVVPNSLVDGTGTSWSWSSWTPTLTGITQGNGTVEARYIQIGKTVHFYFLFTFGSTSGMGSTLFSLPVTAASYISAAKSMIGTATFHDTSTGFQYVGFSRLDTTTTARGVTFSSSAGTTNISSTVPFTWATGDTLVIQGTYEAA